MPAASRSSSASRDDHVTTDQETWRRRLKPTTWQSNMGIRFANLPSGNLLPPSTRRFSTQSALSMPDDIFGDYAPQRAASQKLQQSQHARVRELESELRSKEAELKKIQRDVEGKLTKLRKDMEAQLNKAQSEVRAWKQAENAARLLPDKLEARTQKAEAESAANKAALQRRIAQQEAIINGEVAQRTQDERRNIEASAKKLKSEQDVVQSRQQDIDAKVRQLEQDRADHETQAAKQDRERLEHEDDYSRFHQLQLAEETAKARRGYEARKQPLPTYDDFKQATHIASYNAGLEAASALDELLQALKVGIDTARNENNLPQDKLQELERHLARLEGTQRFMEDVRERSAKPQHLIRSLLRRSLYDKHGTHIRSPYAVLNTTNTILRGESSGALRLAAEDLEARHLSILHDCADAVREIELLQNEPIEYQQYYKRQTAQITSLSAAVSEVEKTHPGANHFSAAVVKMIEKYAALNQQKAERIVLHKLEGHFSSTEMQEIQDVTSDDLRKAKQDFKNKRDEFCTPATSMKTRLMRPTVGRVAREAMLRKPAELGKASAVSNDLERPNITQDQSLKPHDDNSSKKTRPKTSLRRRLRTTRHAGGKATTKPLISKVPSQERVPSTDSPSGRNKAVVRPLLALGQAGGILRPLPVTSATPAQQSRAYCTAYIPVQRELSISHYDDAIAASSRSLTTSHLLPGPYHATTVGAVHNTVETEWKDVEDGSVERYDREEDVVNDSMTSLRVGISQSSCVPREADPPSVSETASVCSEGPGPVPLQFQIPAQILKDAHTADPASLAAVWSFRHYQNAEGKPVALHYHSKFEHGEAAASKLLSEPILGFDLEWEEFSKPGKHEIKRCVSMLQLANEKSSHLFHIGIWKGTTAEELMPPSLKRLLTSPDVVKAGVNVAGDSNRIRNSFGVQMQGVFELSHMYKLVRYGQDEPDKVDKRLVKLADQVQELLLLPLPKGEVRTSRWSQKLDMAQMEYAASDAYAGFRLYHALDEKRRTLDPAPPRPAFWELSLPIELADGTFAKSAPRVKRGAATSTQDEEGDEFYDALEYQDDADGDSRATEAREDKPKSVRLKGEEIDLANTWIENWLGSRPVGTKGGLTAAPLRAYHLWHVQGFDLEQTAGLLRQPPILITTVASYVLDAIARGHLQYDDEKLKAALEVLPRSVYNRYRGLISKLEDRMKGDDTKIDLK